MPTAAHRNAAFKSRYTSEILVITGVMSDWSEAEWRPRGKARPEPHAPGCRCGCERPRPPRVIVGRQDCPCGCRFRDLPRERRMGLDIYCCRCLTHSDDADDWKIPIPMAIVIADRKARVEKLRQATFAARRFGGRKATRKVASG